MTTWRAQTPPKAPRIGAAGWARTVLRGVPLAVWIFGMLGLHMLLRLVERPLFGERRPVTPWITVAVCRGALAIMGMGRAVRGPRMSGPGAMVANHGSWLDIFALNACEPLYFVSKAEVAGWPGIGLLARATGTVFIRRDRREAGAQQKVLARRLGLGHRLLVFPEGTSTDTLRVLPFKATLFGAFVSDGLRDTLSVQPITVVYHPPKGAEPQFYGWWGDMEFGPHLIKLLARPGHGRVEVIRHAPIPVSEMPDRKTLAQRAEETVRAGLESARPETVRQG